MTYSVHEIKMLMMKNNKSYIILILIINLLPESLDGTENERTHSNITHTNIQHVVLPEPWTAQTEGEVSLQIYISEETQHSLRAPDK